jgi:hypothetical protein
MSWGLCSKAGVLPVGQGVRAADGVVVLSSRV